MELGYGGGGGGGGGAALTDRLETRRAWLSMIRADGVEVAWVEGVVRLPPMDMTGTLPDVIRFETPVIGPENGWSAGVGDGVRFEFGRSTALRDGGISGQTGGLSADNGLMRLSSLASDEGEYDIYDLEVAWDALSPGPVTVSLIGGLKAIEARIGKVVQEEGVSTFRDARGIAAMPVVGGEVRWRVNRQVGISGSATTHALSGQNSVLDLSAQTTIRLAPNIGLSAGYQYIQSALEVRSMETDFEREGVFARIQILF